jgi:hypothetical protein
LAGNVQTPSVTSVDPAQRPQDRTISAQVGR